MKLAHRFALFQSILVTVVLLVCAAAILAGSNWYFSTEIRRTQERTLASFALVAQESVLRSDDLLVVNYLKSLIEDPALAMADFQNMKRNLTLSTNDLRGPVAVLAKPGHDAGPVKAGSFKIELEKQATLSLQSEVLVSGSSVGCVHLHYWKKEVQGRVRESILQFLPVLGLAFLLSLAVGIFAALLMAHQLAVPILELQARTESVKKGRWEDLVEVKGDDELAELSRKFNDMMVQLKELESMKRDFVAGVTHELLSPLNAIHSGVNYLSAGSAGPLTPEQVDYLLILSNSAGQLAEFIGNLLQVSKIEAGKMEIFFEPVDVSSELSAAAKLFTPQAAGKGLSLVADDKTEGRPWVLDRVMFRQVLHNLLSNAIKFTAKGDVRVRLEPEGGRLVLEVSDTGIGIDAQYHRLVFEKFYRVLQPADSPNRKGTGLGLAIAQGILALHGGEVTVESVPGKGSRFRAVFPEREAEG